MAKWRAIWRKIAVSGQVNRMTEFAQFLFERAMLPADDWGIVSGDPWELKAEAMPLSPREPQEFEAALNEMEEQGLIWRYEPPGYGPLVQFINWDDYQPKVLIGNRSDPKTPLHYNHPNYDDFPDLYWKTLENTGKDWKSKETIEKTSKSISISKSISKRKRDKSLQHEAYELYRGMLCHSVKKPKRLMLIGAYENHGVEAYRHTLEMWRDREYNPDNVKGICGATERRAKSAAHKRSDGKRDWTKTDEWKQYEESDSS